MDSAPGLPQGPAKVACGGGFLGGCAGATAGCWAGPGSMGGAGGGRWPWMARRYGVTRHASGDGQAVRLLAALDQRAGAVLAQAGVDGKTNQITAFAPLLESLDLAACVITADAMHTQRGHAEFVVTQKNAHYMLVVKKNQPGLYAQVKKLPWRNIPAGCTQHDRGHSREERRTLQVADVAAGIAFPHAAQAIRLTRRIRSLSAQKNWHTVTVYAITSLTAAQAAPAQFAAGSWLARRVRALGHRRRRRRGPWTANAVRGTKQASSDGRPCTYGGRSIRWLVPCSARPRCTAGLKEITRFAPAGTPGPDEARRRRCASHPVHPRRVPDRKEGSPLHPGREEE